jgi:hypothetical protein
MYTLARSCVTSKCNSASAAPAHAGHVNFIRETPSAR